MGGLRPCAIGGGEESLGEAAGDGAKGAVEICGGVDSASRDETVGGPGADVGAAESRGGVEALVRDADAAAFDAES